MGKKVTIKNAYSSRYRAGGDGALVDGQRGSINFRDELWQGYQSVDFEAVVDLGELTSINEIGVSFIQNQSSWIFFPKEVEIAFSTDGQSYEVIKTVTIDTEISLAHEIKEISAHESRSGRFVKVTAQNVSICPEWHPSAGGKAWLFVDEIVIK